MNNNMIQFHPRLNHKDLISAKTFYICNSFSFQKFSELLLFIFRYEDSQVGSAEINTQRSGVESQILKAVQCRMNAMRDK